ncbi:MAG: hypothetical protein ACP5Q4_08035, partial [Candidatus Caldatribacteriaceae bacterium]
MTFFQVDSCTLPGSSCAAGDPTTFFQKLCLGSWQVWYDIPWFIENRVTDPIEKGVKFHGKKSQSQVPALV